MAADSGIDPRYAAQFQRGFDPAQHDAPPPERRGPVPIESVRHPVVHRVPDPPRIVERPAANARVDVAPSTPPDHEPARADLVVARPRTEWALLAVGLLLVGLAGTLFASYVDSMTRTQSVTTTFTQGLYALAAGTLPGPLLVAGIVALCLWVILRSVRLQNAAP